MLRVNRVLLQCIKHVKKTIFLERGATLQNHDKHYYDVIMGAIASQITSITIVYSAVYSDADQRKHQSSASLAFVQGIHRWPVNSPHKGLVTRKMFPFDDVIMQAHNTSILVHITSYWLYNHISRWHAYFYTKYSQYTPQSSPPRARYGGKGKKLHLY